MQDAEVWLNRAKQSQAWFWLATKSVGPPTSHPPQETQIRLAESSEPPSVDLGGGQGRVAGALGAGSWGEAEGRGWMRPPRMFSRQVQYSQCDGTLREASLGECGHHGELWQGCREYRAMGVRGEARMWASSWHQGPSPSRAGPEGGAGLRSLLGHQRRALRSGQGRDTSGPSESSGSGCRPSGVFSPTALCRKSSQHCPAQLLSLETSPCSSVQVRGLKGASIPHCPPCVLQSTGLRVPSPGEFCGAGCSPGGTEEKRVLGRACQPPSSVCEPPGLLINISSVCGASCSPL